jgi:hypothetical protein
MHHSAWPEKKETTVTGKKAECDALYFVFTWDCAQQHGAGRRQLNLIVTYVAVCQYSRKNDCVVNCLKS